MDFNDFRILISPFLAIGSGETILFHLKTRLDRDDRGFALPAM
jgi:hypothetical protein